MPNEHAGTFIRLSRVSQLARTARHHHERMRSLIDVVKKVPEPAAGDDDAWASYNVATADALFEVDEEAMIVVVMSAAAAEAYIYDLAARNLGDSYAESHLDKLLPVSRWIVTVRLISGRDLDPGIEPQQGLGSLFKARNEIVHHKTKDIAGKSPDELQSVLEKGADLPEQASAAILTLDCLAKEARSFDVTAPTNLDADLKGTGWIGGEV